MRRYLLSTMPLALMACAALPAAGAPGGQPLTPPLVLGQAKTIQFLAVWYENDVEKAVSQAWLKTPNKAYAEDTDRQRGGTITIYVSDGKTQTEHHRSRSHDTRTTAPALLNGIDSEAIALAALSEFYAPAQFGKFQPLGAQMGPGSEISTKFVRSLGLQEGRTKYEVLTVDARTGLPKTLELTFELPTAESNDDDDKNGRKNRQTDERIDFHNWILNQPIEASKFRYTPTQQARPTKLEEALKAAVIR